METMKQWIYCPVCHGKTHTMCCENTELYFFPLYCPKCKHQSIINYHNLELTVIKEPDQQSKSR